MAALRRAYRKAGFSPATVGLFEAHGTGTVVGDRAEAVALSTVLEENGARPQSSAVGSVKSMIGHTKATAGVASIAKTALALYHKVLPPTLGVTEPNPDARLDGGPLYVNAETRPWIRAGETPRRAGASSFGFGGTNFHAVLEEYSGEISPVKAASSRWPSELVLLEGRSREEIAARIARILPGARDGGSTLLGVARSAWSERDLAGSDRFRLAIVASSTADLAAKLEEAKKGLDKGGRIHDARGIYFSGEAKRAKVAFLFPGQGSQYPNMLRDLAVHFHEVRERFEAADRVLADFYDEPLSRFVFPPPAFREEQARAQQESLTRTDVAQPALGAADVALASLLAKLGVAPDMAAGHSYGEYVALSVAGAFDFEDLCRISRARGRSIIEAGGEDLGTMAAADAGAADRPHRDPRKVGLELN
jgi:acyl transferase domain-containing protein